MRLTTGVGFTLALALAALLVSCGDGGSPAGPKGDIGPNTGIAFIGRGPDQLSPNLFFVDADSGATRQVTDVQGSVWWPTWSRDRQRLGFIVWPTPPTPTATSGTPTAAITGTAEVTAAATNGTPTATLTGTATTTPTPAPTVDPESVRKIHIEVANADGSDQRPIGESVLIQGFSGGFSWSPDKNSIVYTAVREPSEVPIHAELRLVAVGGGSEETFSGEHLGYLPEWSPDGTKIVFGAFVGELDAQGQGESEIFMMDSDGSNVRQITDRPGLDVAPSWSPDGTRIVWWGENTPADQSSQTTVSVLFMTDVASGQITELGEGSDPVWSPDGQHVAFVVQDQPPPGTVEARPNVDIYTVDVGTGERTQLTQSPAIDLWPTWSLDGQRLAFVSLRDIASGEIYVMNADGTNVRRLTDNKLNEAMLAWAPR
jgi:Tol biopolymer transport system component